MFHFDTSLKSLIDIFVIQAFCLLLTQPFSILSIINKNFAKLQTVLFTQGQATNSFIVVLSGTLSVHLRGLEMNRHVQIDTEMKDHAITRHGSGVSKLMLHSLSLQDTNTKVEDIEARISKLEQQYGPSVCILSNGDGYGWTEGDAAFATVVTISDCEFIRLEESDFRDALRNVGDTKSWNYRDFFASQADVQVWNSTFCS